MKNSGIEWIGEIPDDWNVESLQWYIDEVKVSNNPIQTNKVLSLTNKAGVIPYEEKGAQGNVSKEDYTQYKLAYPDTIVANSMNILIGSVGICRYFGCVSPVYYVFKPNQNADLEFINYIFQCTPFQKELRRYANGILEIRLRVSANGILKRKVAIPSLVVQKKIVDAINTSLQKVDALIANQQEQIEKLKEYKQAVITEAVTKGLNPTAPMKDSGIEWIGEIPAHCTVQKIKFNAQIRNEKSGIEGIKYIALENIESFSGRIIETENSYEITEAKDAFKGDVLFGKLRPYLAKACLLGFDANVSSEFAIFVPIKVKGEFLMWYFLGSGFLEAVNASTYGTKMPRANVDFIKNLYITVFDESQQKEIIEYLDKKCADIDNLIALKQRKIEKLNEYKKSLIYEYVTGKKEVI